MSYVYIGYPIYYIAYEVLEYRGKGTPEAESSSRGRPLAAACRGDPPPVFPSWLECLLYEGLAHFSLYCILSEFYFPQNKARSPDPLLSSPLLHTVPSWPLSHSPGLSLTPFLHCSLPISPERTPGWPQNRYVLSASIPRDLEGLSVFHICKPACIMGCSD